MNIPYFLLNALPMHLNTDMQIDTYLSKIKLCAM